MIMQFPDMEPIPFDSIENMDKFLRFIGIAIQLSEFASYDLLRYHFDDYEYGSRCTLFYTTKYYSTQFTNYSNPLIERIYLIQISLEYKAMTVDEVVVVTVI